MTLMYKKIDFSIEVGRIRGHVVPTEFFLDVLVCAGA
jgi:hypothetical protein